MRRSLLVGLMAAALLAGCETRLNPFNWFGGSEETRVPVSAAEAPTVVPQDPRPTVDQVASLIVDRVPGGALVTATAVPATQGWFEAALVPETRDEDGAPIAENGVMAFRFVAVPPRSLEPTGSDASREISAGVFLTDQTLEGVRSISVRAQRNQRTSRR